MHRHALSDAQGGRLQRVLPNPRTGPTSTLGDRTFIEAVLFRSETGMPWRDHPEPFGPWKSVYDRFANGSRRGHWAAVFRGLQLQVDETGSIVDGSAIGAHQDASGGRGGSNAMLWAALEEALRPSSTPSSTPKDDRSTSRSRKADGTKESPPKSCSNTHAARR